jgi:hypothetical protein
MEFQVPEGSGVTLELKRSEYLTITPTGESWFVAPAIGRDGVYTYFPVGTAIRIVRRTGGHIELQLGRVDKAGVFHVAPAKSE